MIPKLVMAPLLGYTDLVYRETYGAHFPGAVDRVLAPFLSLSESSVPKRIQEGFLPGEVPQLLGNHPETLAEAVKRLVQQGFTEVNWNLGCPVPAVARKVRGSGLLPYPEKIRMGLEALCGSGTKISVKLRLGRNSLNESSALVSLLSEFPLTEVIVHPRLGVQMYEGQASVDGFKIFYEGIPHPISWSGDINSKADYDRLIKEFPRIYGVYFGRGLASDPMLPEKIRGSLSAHSPKERFKDFYETLWARWKENYPQSQAFTHKLKSFWSYPLAGMTWTSVSWNDFKKLSTQEHLNEFIEKLWDRWPDDQDLGPFQADTLKNQGMEKAG